MPSSSNRTLSPTVPQDKALPFRWGNPMRPTKFRVLVGLGFGMLFWLFGNLAMPGDVGTSTVFWSTFAAAAGYLLAEVLLVAAVVVGPLVAFVYGAIAWLMR